jgi:hypothetical protein
MSIKIFLVAVVVLALGSGVFFWQLGRTSDPTVTGRTPAVPAQNMDAVPTNNDPVSGRGSLSELRALARDLECLLVSDADPQSISEGTAFLSDGKIRGDFLAGPPGEQVLSSLIIRDNTLYLWSTIDGETWGVRSDLEAAVTDPVAPKLETQEPIGLHDTVRYDCKPWAGIDGSVFAPPGDVLFRDVESAAAAGMEYGTVFDDQPLKPETPLPDVCTACAAETDSDTRTQCEIEFGCGLQPQ